MAKVFLEEHIGKGLKKNTATKTVDVDLTRYVDGNSIRYINGKLYGHNRITINAARVAQLNTGLVETGVCANKSVSTASTNKVRTWNGEVYIRGTCIFGTGTNAATIPDDAPREWVTDHPNLAYFDVEFIPSVYVTEEMVTNTREAFQYLQRVYIRDTTGDILAVYERNSVDLLNTSKPLELKTDADWTAWRRIDGADLDDILANVAVKGNAPIIAAGNTVALSYDDKALKVVNGKLTLATTEPVEATNLNNLTGKTDEMTNVMRSLGTVAIHTTKTGTVGLPTDITAASTPATTAVNTGNANIDATVLQVGTNGDTAQLYFADESSRLFVRFHASSVASINHTSTTQNGWTNWYAVQLAKDASTGGTTYTASNGVRINGSNIEALLGNNVYLNDVGALSVDTDVIRISSSVVMVRPYTTSKDSEMKADNGYKFNVRAKVSVLDTQAAIHGNSASTTNNTAQEGLNNVRLRLTPSASNQLPITKIEYASTHQEITVSQDNSEWVLDCGTVYNGETKFVDLYVYVDHTPLLSENGATVGTKKAISYDTKVTYDAVMSRFVVKNMRNLRAEITKTT